MSRPVAFRLPEDDYGVLCVFAEAAGLSVGKYAERCVLEATQTEAFTASGPKTAFSSGLEASLPKEPDTEGDFDGRNFVTRQKRIDTLKNRLQQPTKRIT